MSDTNSHLGTVKSFKRQDLSGDAVNAGGAAAMVVVRVRQWVIILVSSLRAVRMKPGN